MKGDNTDAKKEEVKKNPPKCTRCSKEFETFLDVFNHLKEEHSRSCSSSSNLNCDICQKNFSSKGNLSKHIKNFHKLSTLNESLTKTFKCKLCTLEFFKDKFLKEHVKDKHSNLKGSRHHRCSECKESFKSRDSIVDHLKKKHEIPVDIKELHFENITTFEAWKSNVEKDTKSNFIFYYSYKQSNGKIEKHFQCNRNGHYTSKSLGIRRTKLQGTIKSNYFCPAGISIESESTENLFPSKVLYCPTHVGHQCGRLPLSSSKKNIGLEIVANTGHGEVEKNVIAKHLNTDSSNDAGKEILFSLLAKYDTFNQKQQKEMTKSLTKLTYKLEALVPVSVSTIVPRNKNISPQRPSKKKKI